jgi:hypothetical protein
MSYRSFNPHMTGAEYEKLSEEEKRLWNQTYTELLFAEMEEKERRYLAGDYTRVGSYKSTRWGR